MSKIMCYSTDKTYLLKSGPYDDERPEFDHVQPAVEDNGQMFIVDCWICDKHGNVHPGYNVSPVPIYVHSFIDRRLS